MTDTTFDNIAAKFADLLADASVAEQASITKECIGEMAERVASVVFLSSHARVAATPVEERPALAGQIDAVAALVATDLGTQVRRALFPNLPADAPATGEEQLAIRSYWAALERIVATTHLKGGNA